MNTIRLFLFLLLAARPFGQLWAADTNTVVLYYTQFEKSEKFDQNYTLMGQNGWTGSGDGGNGLVENYFEGMGQQAFIGFSKPSGTNASLFLWYPNSNVKTQYTRIRFWVDMSIVDSENKMYDEFRWSVYNTAGEKLCALSFDNYSQTVAYTLDDDNGLISTGRKFTNSVLYTVMIDLDFNLNLWCAFLDDYAAVINQPIVKSKKLLNFGDVDAVWVLTTPGKAGDNYMLFDNYEIDAVKVPLATLDIPKFTSIQRVGATSVLLRLSGSSSQPCRLEYSDSLASWKTLKTATFTDTGTLDVVDDTATAATQRYYRAVYTP